MFKNLMCISLKLHDSGAGGSAGASGSVAGATGGTPTGTTGTPESSQPVSGEKTKVVYGKQEAPAAAEEVPTTPAAGEKGKTTSDTLEARRAEFEKLINGDYKDMFTERMQSVIDRRFKETKGLQEQLKGYQPIAQILADKYNVDANDAKALTEAIEKDDRYWEEAADEAGMTVEQFKQMQKLKRDNAQLLEAERQRGREQFANETFQRWERESEALKQTYPEFNLQMEAQNAEFARLIQSNVSLKTAYEVVHMDDIKNNVAQTVGKQVESNMANTIKAKGNRPAEAGASPTPGMIVKSDVHNLTADDRREVVRRAMRGEKIQF